MMYMMAARLLMTSRVNKGAASDAQVKRTSYLVENSAHSYYP